MADGVRAGSRVKLSAYCDWEADQVERAARLVARMFGCGSGWLAVCLNYAEAPAGSELTGTAPRDGLSVARRGRPSRNVVQIDGNQVRLGRRTHEWRLDRGALTVPATSPHVEDAAALSFARLGRNGLDLMLVFGCEDIQAWLRIEPNLHRASPTPHAKIAGRDAMARIMWRRAPTSLEDRARELQIRAAVYRGETRASEEWLRTRLLEAAIRLNDAVRERPGPSVHPADG